MKSIRQRLFFTYGAILLFAFLLLGIILQYSLEKYFINQAEENLAPQARMAAMLIKPSLSTKDYAKMRNLVKIISIQNNIRITVVAPDGTVLADSESDYKKMENHLNRPEIMASKAAGIGFSSRLSHTLSERMLYCAYSINRLGYIRVAVSLSQINAMFNHVRLLLISVLAAVALITLFVGAKTAKTITDPLYHLKSVAEAISKGNLTARANIFSRDELGVLAHSLNKMAAIIQEYVDKINAEKEQLEIIFENMSAGIIVFNPEGEILLLNGMAEKLFQFSRFNIKGKTLQKLIREEGFYEAFDKSLKQGKAYDYEFKYLNNYLHVHFIPLLHVAGDKKIVVLVYDITSIKHWQQLRSDFVANASHELRTPLTAIKGYTETLLDGAMSDPITARTFLEIIDKESERLTRIVEDLLDLSRLERKAALNKELFSLRKLVEEKAKIFSAQMTAKKLNFTNEVDERLLVLADYDWLGQVFLNLFDNAVKYSKESGQIIVKAKEDDEFIVVEVSDNGIGIPYDDLNRIFERFYRVDKSRSRSLGGTGLGLAIVKHVIESHGGKVGAASALGEGTTISFSMPKHKLNLT